MSLRCLRLGTVRGLCEEEVTLSRWRLQTAFQAMGAGPRHLTNSEARGYVALSAVVMPARRGEGSDLTATRSAVDSSLVLSSFTSGEPLALAAPEQ